MDYPDTLMAPETVTFNGRLYRLMGGPRRYYLSQSTKNPGRKNPKGLHVAIWEHANGQSVSKGYAIHHIDGNPFNNSPCNLEHLSRSEHAKKVVVSQKMRDHLARIRPLTKAWHGSEEGRAWHRNHASTCERRTYINKCLHCGNEFEAKNFDAKYCSNWCTYKYKRSIGMYNRKVECVICGTLFDTIQPINPSEIAKTCSYECRGELSKRRRVQPDS